MIIDLSNEKFKKIFEDERLFLPIRWNGTDFLLSLTEHLNYYLDVLETNKNHIRGEKISVDVSLLKRIIGLIIKSVEHYLNGFPSKAYTTFDKAMRILIRSPLKVYQKSAFELFGNYHDD